MRSYLATKAAFSPVVFIYFCPKYQISLDSIHILVKFEQESMILEVKSLMLAMASPLEAGKGHR